MPKHTSQHQFLQDRKYYAKEDVLLLDDYKEKLGERDPTKPYREKKKAEEVQEPERKEAKKIIVKKSALPKGTISQKKSWTATEI